MTKFTCKTTNYEYAERACPHSKAYDSLVERTGISIKHSKARTQFGPVKQYENPLY